MTKATLLFVFLLPLIIHAQQFAVYTLSYGSPNMINVFSGNASGYLTYVNGVSTGGSGSTIVGGVQSEHSLFVSGNFLFAVNPSSSTLSLFSISPTNPTVITLIGTPQSTGGDFPVSVTASNGVACVVNSGQSNGFQCFTYSSAGLTLIPNSYHSLGLNLTTPPVTHTGPAQISFTPDGSALVISNKLGTPTLYFALVSNGVAPAVVSSPNFGMVPFGFAFASATSLVLTFAGSGLAVATANLATSSITFSTPFVPPNEAAACWVSRSPKYGYFYVGYAMTATMGELILNNDLSFTVNMNYPLSGSGIENSVATIGGVDYVFQIANANSTSNTPQQIFVFRLAQLGATQLQMIPTMNSATGGGLAVYVAASASSSSTGVASSSGQSGSAPTAASCSLPFFVFVTIVSLLSLLL